LIWPDARGGRSPRVRYPAQPPGAAARPRPQQRRLAPPPTPPVAPCPPGAVTSGTALMGMVAWIAARRGRGGWDGTCRFYEMAMTLKARSPDIHQSNPQRGGISILQAAHPQGMHVSAFVDGRRAVPAEFQYMTATSW